MKKITESHAKHSANVPGPLAALIKQNVRFSTSATGLVTAAEAIGRMTPGMALAGITKGGFSMLDIIQHILGEIGSADIDVSTWTMGVYDADVLWQFVRDRSIRSIRFVVDPSMFGRKVELSTAFLAAFGAETIRAIDNHAKFTLIGNEAWQITICSSMNLNRNARLENFVLLTDPGVYAFYRAIVDSVFRDVGPYWAGKKRTREEFDGLSFGDERREPPIEVW